MFCPRCGNPITPGKRFCGRCGAKIEAAPDLPEAEKSAGPEERKEVFSPSVFPLRPEENAPAPSAETPIAPRAAASAEAPVQKKKKSNAGRIVLSVFLAVLFAVSLLLSSVLTVIRVSFSKEGVEECVDSLDLASLELPLGVYGDRVKLSRYLYDELKNQVKDLTQEKIETFLSLPALKNALKDGIEVYRGYLIDGKDTNGLTSDFIVEYLLSHEKELEEAILSSGLAASAEDLHLDRESLEKNIRKEIGESLTIDRLIYGAEKEAGLAAFAVSAFSTVAAWVVVLLLLVFLFLVNRRALRAAVCASGIATGVVGGVLLIGHLASRYWLKIASLSYLKPLYDATLSPRIRTCAIVLLGLFAVAMTVTALLSSPRKKKGKTPSPGEENSISENKE